MISNLESNSPGVLMIATERHEQLTVHGFTPSRDDQYTRGQLGAAAECYLIYANLLAIHGVLPPCFIPRQWPKDWDRKWWKPSQDVTENLAKAGALAAAEIDRLKRLIK